MKLFLKNIGKVCEAAIELNGITVIAGENDTGKSTVGRTLFSIFSGFYNIDKVIKLERIKNIETAIKLTNSDTDTFFSIIRYNDEIHELAKEIISDIETTNDESIIKNKIINLISQHDEEFKDSLLHGDINTIIKHIIMNSNISDETMLRYIIEKNFEGEFSGQISNIFSNNEGEIRLKIKKSDLKIGIRDNSIIDIQNNLVFNSEAIYIDDPYILDNTINANYYSFLNYLENQNFNYMDHHSHLKKKLSKRNTNENIVDEIIAKNKLKKVFELLSVVCSGNIIQNEGSIYEYKEAGSDNTLAVKNISTGLKTFAILKKLLLDGSIKYNGTIILDEPEIHLHPEWQLLFAEIIVLLQKDFNLHILINTHSPYFLRAIQVYSAKYEIADKCKYYLSETDGNLAYISDVTDDIEQIYSKLARPLQDLENERWQDD